MRNLIVSLFFVIPFWGMCQWGDGDNQMNADDFKGPKIEWEFELHDFGDIPKDNPVKIKFVFTNTGNAPLIITEVEPSCGCTAADYTKTPVMPGQKGFVLATYDAEDSGNFSKSITVTSNTKPANSILKFQGSTVN